MTRFSVPRFRNISPRAAALAALALALIPLQAAAERISCPQAQIRREVTTPLPSGWWNTPIVANLAEVAIITIGGRTALQCRYGAAGNIQRYAPEGAECRVVGRAFECAPAAPAARTFSTGRIELRQTYLADLDRGRVDSGPAADLWFQAETADLLYLVPNNGARLGISGPRSRGFAGCSDARMSTARVSLRDTPVGTYVCMRTNEGRISEFRVNGISAGSPKVLSLGYTTWE